jgi:hypothetical protein
MPHPNSLANLRPWKPGQAPSTAGPKKIEQALKITQQSCPKAARLITRAIDNPELPMSLRLRCAEYVLDKALPPQQASGSLSIGQGVEWLELRFVAPGGQAAESHRIAFQEAEVITVGSEETEA